MESKRVFCNNGCLNSSCFFQISKESRMVKHLDIYLLTTILAKCICKKAIKLWSCYKATSDAQVVFWGSFSCLSLYYYQNHMRYRKGKIELQKYKYENITLTTPCLSVSLFVTFSSTHIPHSRVRYSLYGPCVF